MARQARVCELCGARYDTTRGTCPLDGAQLRDAPDPLVGRVIGGRFALEEQIGSGGMGVVYRARNIADDSLVAIKFLDHVLARSKQNRERFLREARAANRIDHEHIIHIMNYGETEDALIYLVMEYLDGVPLNVEIYKGQMRIERALDIALQIAEALARAHELDVVHRDIKPENVFLLSSVGGDFVKVLDFGLAHMKGEMKLTLTGAVFGTPEYMAPEQCLGDQSTGSVDLYALGAVLFEMLTGTIPYAGNIAQMLEQHVRGAIPVPSSRRRDIPNDVDELIMKMMAKKPEDRFHDAYHVVETISKVLGRAAQRERVASRAPAHSQMTSRTVDIEGAWTKRVEEFSSWMPKAHPLGDAPAWVTTELEALTSLAAELGEVRGRLHAVNAKAAEREREDRDLRLRIGSALDELGRDESRLARDMEESQGRLDGARARLESAEAPLRDAWVAVQPPPASMPAPATVEHLRDLGHLAAIWLEAQRAVSQLAREADARLRERDDLRYQIAQLKQRLASADAESETETTALRGQAAELGTRRQALLDDLTQRAEGVYRYFMAVPGFRDAVGMARQAVS